MGPYITVFVNQKDPAVCVHNTVLNRLSDRLNSTNAALVSGAEFSRKIVVTRVCVNDRVDRVCDHVNQFCRKFKISGTDFGSMDVLAIRAYTLRDFPSRSKIIFRSHFPILEAADSDQVSGGCLSINIRFPRLATAHFLLRLNDNYVVVLSIKRGV